MNKLYKVINGNCNITLYKDGTRVVETIDPKATEIKLDYPLSLDINISNRCSNGCPYCYAGNTPNGKVANLLDMDYLDGVSGIEIAINMQFPLPDNFELWLAKMKKQKIVVNGTINQLDFERNPYIMDYLAMLHEKGLLHGIGVSYHHYDNSIYGGLKAFLGDDIVIHTIVGITPIDDIIKLLDRGFKVLILGYKQKNRGIDYFANINIEKWKQDIGKILNHQFTSVVAFDTAGLKQLGVQELISKEQWDNSYQGDEGTISFYIDAVKNTFNIDSHTNDPAHDIGKLSIKEMFNIVRSGINENNET